MQRDLALAEAAHDGHAAVDLDEGVAVEAALVGGLLEQGLVEDPQRHARERPGVVELAARDLRDAGGLEQRVHQALVELHGRVEVGGHLEVLQRPRVGDEQHVVHAHAQVVGAHALGDGLGVRVVAQDALEVRHGAVDALGEVEHRRLEVRQPVEHPRRGEVLAVHDRGEGEAPHVLGHLAEATAVGVAHVVLDEPRALLVGDVLAAADGLAVHVLGHVLDAVAPAHGDVVGAPEHPHGGGVEHRDARVGVVGVEAEVGVARDRAVEREVLEERGLTVGRPRGVEVVVHALVVGLEVDLLAEQRRAALVHDDARERQDDVVVDGLAGLVAGDPQRLGQVAHVGVPARLDVAYADDFVGADRALERAGDRFH